MNIETERLIIKPLTLDDARRFSEYRDKEEVAMYQSWDEYPLNKAINRIEYCQKHPFHGQIGNYQFGLYLKENNRLIGDIFIRPLPACITPTFTLEAPSLCGAIACSARVACAAANKAL